MGVTASKTIHATSGIYKFLFAGVKRVTNRADFDVDFFDRGTGLKFVAATTLDVAILVFGVDALFHDHAWA